MREIPAICTRLCVVALGVPLLAAETIFLVLLCAFEVLAVTGTSSLAAVTTGVGVVELDVEEIFLVGLCDICARSLCDLLAWRPTK